MAGSELNGVRVAKTEVIEYALETLGITERDDCIMIGDRLHDIIGAKKSGMRSIGVLWGYGSEKEFHDAGADYICPSVENLIDIIG